MRGGILLIVIALVVIYLGVSNKFCCFTQFLKCAVSNAENPCECASQPEAITSNILPALPKLPALPTLTSFG